MPIRKQKAFKIIIILALLSLPLVVSAAGLVPCGDTQHGEQPCTVYDVFYLIAHVTNWLIMVAGIYAVYKIIDGGFLAYCDDSEGNIFGVIQPKM